MGLNKYQTAAILLLIPGCLMASPKLRLSASTVGPVSIAVGANGATQTVEAYNVGDGSLNLSLTSSVSWITASVGSQRTCTTRSGVCLPLSFALNTSGLSAGTVTGIVKVSDPNAVDAPQTVTVTVQMGGSVPASVDVYVAAGGSRDVSFSTNSPLTASTRTSDGASWLSVALDGVGSFRFSYPYRIHVAPPSSMAAGTYSGTVTLSGSSFAGDNKAVPVTMRVTAQPVAVASTSKVTFRLAQGAPASTSYVSLSNAGSGTLTVSDASGSGGSWLTVAAYSGGAAVTVKAASDLAPGTYSGTVTISTNAANGNVSVPVELQVVAKGAPLINFQGVVDNGTFVAGDAATGGDVMVVLGEQLSFSELTVGKAPPLATQIGGAQVLVNGVPAPMYYSSYGQLAFQMPYNVSSGSALVQVVRDGLTSNTASVDIASRAPRILLIGVGTYGAVVNQDGSILMPTGSFPGVSTHPAQAGDWLTIYAIGLGATSPQPASGDPAPSSEPLARVLATPTVVFGGAAIGAPQAVPLFTGLTPTYAGLYQVNVQVPANVPKGDIGLTLAFADTVSNTVTITVQ